MPISLLLLLYHPKCKSVGHEILGVNNMHIGLVQETVLGSES